MRNAFKLQAPFVDYEDEAEFHHLFHETCAQYQHLVGTALAAQAEPGPSQGENVVSLFAWTKAESMSLGLADFSSLYEHGPVVLLRMTKKRGLRYVIRVNEQLVAAVTACCRTYFNTLNERFNRRVYNHDRYQPGHVNVFDLQHVDSLMRQTVMDILGHTVNSQCTYTHDLHTACFAYYTHPRNGLVMCRIPRKKVCDYLIAFASLSHHRLGDRTLGVHLNADTMRLIMQMIDFH